MQALVFSLGIIVLFWPGISLLVLLTVLGIWLIFYGVVLVALALRLRHYFRSDAARTALT